METNNDKSPVDAAVFDAAGCLAQIGGEVDLLEALIEAHLEQEPLLLAQFASAVRTGEAVPLRQAAHALASAVSALGASRARAAAKHVEEMAQRGDLANLTAASRQLHEEFQRLHQALTSPAYRRAA